MTGQPDSVWWAVRDAVLVDLALTDCPNPAGVALAAANAAEDAVGDLTLPPTPDRRPWVAWAVEQLGTRNLTPAELAAAMRRVADEVEQMASRQALGTNH